MTSSAWRPKHLLSSLTTLAVWCGVDSAIYSSSKENNFFNNARRLDEGVSADYDYFEYDLANFSLRFDRCQHVKMYDDELAEDEDSASPLATKHFAVFRLCPSDSCEECDEGVFGRYLIEAEEYLAYTVAEQQEYYEYICANCAEQCGEEYGTECTSGGCGEMCNTLDNLEAYGYVDAANFIQCQKLEINYDDDAAENSEDDADDGEEDGDEEESGDQEDGDEDGEEGEHQEENAENGNQRRLDQAAGDDDGNNQFELYIGPRCSGDGSKIKIGLFTDNECLSPYFDADPEDFLGGKLSYYAMAHTASSNGDTCLSCAENNADKNDADDADADNVNEMCEELYAESGKCESKYGLSGFLKENRMDGEYENQIENEFMVCNFIESLLLESYTQEGEVNLELDMEIVFREATKLQKLAVSLLSISILGLLTAVNYLKRQIENSTAKLDLSCQSTDAQLT